MALKSIAKIVQEIEDNSYLVHLQIESEDRNYLLSDLVTVLQQNAIGIKGISSNVNNDSLTATTKIDITVRNGQMLEKLIANLKKVHSVNEVIRTIK